MGVRLSFVTTFWRVGRSHGGTTRTLQGSFFSPEINIPSEESGTSLIGLMTGSSPRRTRWRSCFLLKGTRATLPRQLFSCLILRFRRQVAIIKTLTHGPFTFGRFAMDTMQHWPGTEEARFLVLQPKR